MVVAILSSTIGCIHFLIRPHLFTFGFFYLTLRACRKQHQDGGWSVFLVSLYTLVLANLHGGFLSLPVIVATAGLGHATIRSLGSPPVGATWSSSAWLSWHRACRPW